MKSVAKRLYDAPDDFEADIRILREDEGGRKTPVCNSIRWDFCYRGEGSIEPYIHMIWPDFIDSRGNSLPEDEMLPVDHTLKARLTILSDEVRQTIHRDRIKVGVRFYCQEASKRVAEGIVTRITGLHAPR